MLFCMRKDALLLVLRTIIDCSFYKLVWVSKKVQVDKDQEKAQSEKDSHSKNRGGKVGKKQTNNQVLYTIKTYRKPNEQLFSQ